MNLLHDLILRSAGAQPDHEALIKSQDRMSYAELAAEIERVAAGLIGVGLGRLDRVAIYLPKRFETVVAMFATSHAGGIFVPVNPLLKPAQVTHILQDSGASVLITDAGRFASMSAGGIRLSVDHVVIVGDTDSVPDLSEQTPVGWSVLPSAESAPAHRVIDQDPVAILYTSGSTGRPKGVVLSHRNMVSGAQSVAQYLQNRSSDRLLSVLPFSFDYGFSQLSTAFHSGASVVLLDYLMPRDVLRAVSDHGITGLAAVPPLWVQLVELDWPDPGALSLRYITNSGGAMPQKVLRRLQARVGDASIYLMYGLTEAFRSTFLSPDLVNKRPTSIGKAIPGAEIRVVRPDGSESGPGEPGELVHRGALVALGYWRDPERTAERFRPAPGRLAGIPTEELAVWSGDTVTRDEEGFLYFVGRFDDMIKTSGYRVSPTEIEDVIFATGIVREVAAVGAPHPVLGKAVVIFAISGSEVDDPTDALLAACRRELPAYMVPALIEWRESLPRNPNGKIDRTALAASVADRFAAANDERAKSE